ncbi:MAG TPA: hypothetical protein DCF68_09330 [Cyanothece sp. UBA12306]|nr:hypothetical protein [Cyanothece sp. UBA12306]
MSSQETQQFSSETQADNLSIPSHPIPEHQLLLESLEWSETEIMESYFRLKHLEEDWNQAEMDVYDNI